MLGLILEYRGDAQTIFAWVVCIAAIFRGGGPEKAIALTWLVLFEILLTGYRAIVDPPFQPNELSLVTTSVDLAAMIILIIVAVKANRIYPLWVAALQVLATLSHFVNAIADHISPIAYVILAVTPGYFQLFLLAGGLHAHMRRQKKYGAYRDWSQSIGQLFPQAARATKE